ncbi:MAG: hypothetical protein DRR16_27355, partial [Candidatus Parabeggiatoa sp. nov. 3]
MLFITQEAQEAQEAQETLRFLLTAYLASLASLAFSLILIAKAFTSCIRHKTHPTLIGGQHVTHPTSPK